MNMYRLNKIIFAEAEAKKGYQVAKIVIIWNNATFCGDILQPGLYGEGNCS